jgi:hypothetical protein
MTPCAATFDIHQITHAAKLHIGVGRAMASNMAHNGAS